MSVCVQEISDILLKKITCLVKVNKVAIPKDFLSDFLGCKFFTFNVTSKAQVNKNSLLSASKFFFTNHYSKHIRQSINYHTNRASPILVFPERLMFRQT